MILVILMIRLFISYFSKQNSNVGKLLKLYDWGVKKTNEIKVPVVQIY